MNVNQTDILDILPEAVPNDIVDAAIKDYTEKSEAQQSAKERAKQLLKSKRAKPDPKSIEKEETTIAEILPTKPSASPAVQQAVEILHAKAPEQKSQATTREGVVRLMNALNIDLDLQLTKNDTATLLSCLLTANETQLHALYNNSKIPITIKTVIKRLLDDSKTGNMETIERMWDRLFGKNPMTESVSSVPGAVAGSSGLIPNGPVSRETYIFIREQLMGA